jgi:hypothetical protein
LTKLTHKSFSKTNLTISGLIALFLSYLVLNKAFGSSFTHDEAFSYLFYISTSFKKIITYSFPTANNHMLNSLMARLSLMLFGNDEIFLRLPNVLAFIAYITFFIRWINTQTKNIFLIIFAFCFTFLNNEFFEFFSLCRGYGLSFLFIFLALIQLNQSANSNRFLTQSKLFITLTLMVLANFSTLYIFLAMSFVYFLIQLKNGNSIWKSILPPLFYSLGMISFISLGLYRLISNNQLYFGGDVSFFKDTFSSLIQGLLYGLKTPKALPFVFLAILLIMSYVTLIKTISQIKKNQPISKTGIFILVLGFTIILNIISHTIFGSKFLTHRTALIYYPLLTLFVIQFSIDYIDPVLSNLKKNMLFSLLAIPLTLVFTYTYSITDFKSWKFDSDTKQITHELNDLGQLKANQIRIGSDMYHQPSFNYYRVTNNYTLLDSVYKDSIPPNVNVIIWNGEFPKRLEGDFELKKIFKNSNSYLYLKKELN